MRLAFLVIVAVGAGYMVAKYFGASPLGTIIGLVVGLVMSIPYALTRDNASAKSRKNQSGPNRPDFSNISYQGNADIDGFLALRAHRVILWLQFKERYWMATIFFLSPLIYGAIVESTRAGGLALRVIAWVPLGLYLVYWCLIFYRPVIGRKQWLNQARSLTFRISAQSIDILANDRHLTLDWRDLDKVIMRGSLVIFVGRRPRRHYWLPQDSLPKDILSSLQAWQVLSRPSLDTRAS